MSGYWVSQEKHWCEHCRTWTQGDAISIRIHENGKKHKENVQRFLAEQERDKVKKSMQEDKTAALLRSVEAAAGAAMRGHAAFADSRLPLGMAAAAVPADEDPLSKRPRMGAGPGAEQSGDGAEGDGDDSGRTGEQEAQSGPRIGVGLTASEFDVEEEEDVGDEGGGKGAVKSEPGSAAAAAAVPGSTAPGQAGGRHRVRVVYLTGAGAAAYAALPGAQVEARSLVYPGGSSSGSAPVALWEKGEVVRVVAPMAGGEKRFVVRVATTVSGAGGEVLQADALRDAAEGEVRLRLGRKEDVDAARAAGIDPAAIAAAPRAGSSGRSGEAGWRAPTLREATERALSRQKAAAVAASEAAVGAAGSGSGPDGEKPEQAEDELGPEPSGWETVAVREITQEQAAMEAGTTIEDVNLGVDKLNAALFGGGARASTAHGQGDFEQPEFYRGVRISGHADPVKPPPAPTAGSVADAEPLDSGAPAAVEVEASADVLNAGFKRRRVRSKGATRRK